MFRARLHTCLAFLAATTLAGAATAQSSTPEDYEADVVADIVFLSTSAGQIQDFEFEYDGAVDILQIEIGFQSYDPDSWAADLAIALIDPNGNAVHFGGYDLFFNYDNFLGQFPDSWRGSTPGLYAHELNIAGYELQGNGLWTMRLMNGYSQSGGSQWGGLFSMGDCQECIVDCNGNGISDTDEISNGDSADCDGNGIPDACEPDCDNDGIPDACEIDSNLNRIPDDCEFEPGEVFDFTLRGPGGSAITIPFANNTPITDVKVDLEFQTNDLWTWASDLQIILKTPSGSAIQLGGFNLDMAVNYGDFPEIMNSHLDGKYSYTFALPQRFEGEAGEWRMVLLNGYQESFDGFWSGTINLGHNGNYMLDCNANGVEDTEELAAGDASDCNGNGIPDSCDVLSGGDSNGDGALDTCQLDCSTVVPFAFAGNASREISIDFPFTGSAFQIRCQTEFQLQAMDLTWAGDLLVLLTDPNGQSIEFGGHDYSFGSVASAGDFPGSWDITANGSYPEATFNLLSSGLSGDGIWNLRITNGFAASSGARWTGSFVICNIDPVEIIQIQDCNNNDIDDADDIASGLEDCNANGLPDICDITEGAFDTNDNNRIDECERAEGDLNLDGCVNSQDGGLLLAVVGIEDPPYGDLDGDGDVDIEDFLLLQENIDPNCVPIG